MIPFLLLPIVAIQIGWYIAVIIFLFKIWQKVKNLPG
jgi:hypothetical protein